jgi:pilus assembly protein Flp/PilA
MKVTRNLLQDFLRAESAAGMVEYVLLAELLVLAGSFRSASPGSVHRARLQPGRPQFLTGSGSPWGPQLGKLPNVAIAESIALRIFRCCGWCDQRKWQEVTHSEDGGTTHATAESQQRSKACCIRRQCDRTATLQPTGRNRMNRPSRLLSSLLNDESGQDLIEYALIAALIAVAVITAMKGLDNKINNEFNSIGNSLWWIFWRLSLRRTRGLITED